ncbi:MAG: site-2 protease family protein [Anaerolineae bacterium]|nr:site-2 protease family protein [Anaerolineae bacterium]
MLLFGNPTLENLIGVLLAVGIGMTIHEFAHNYVAYLMGDPVPAQQGRLTLNPFVHINWVGWLMFALIGFGILGSAPIAAHRMRNPRWGFLAAVAAGPVSNLLIAIVFGIAFKILPASVLYSSSGMFASLSAVGQILYIIVYFNVLLFLFNLLPFFPLDGWHIVYALLPPAQARIWGSNQWRMYSQYAFFALILLSFTGFNLLGRLISGPSFTIARMLLG